MSDDFAFPIARLDWYPDGWYDNVMGEVTPCPNRGRHLRLATGAVVSYRAHRIRVRKIHYLDTYIVSTVKTKEPSP